MHGFQKTARGGLDNSTPTRSKRRVETQKRRPGRPRRGEEKPKAPGRSPTERMLIGITEVAELLSVGRKQVRIWIEEEGLPCIQIGSRKLVPVQEFTRWLASRPRTEKA